jgi:hypothetical protein
MDDFLKKNDNTKLAKLDDKKIEFKQIKEKRATRTYIFNLDVYIQDPVKLDLILVEIKKSLGTACVKKETEFGIGYGFNGAFERKIRDQLVDKYKVTANAFK